MGGGDDDPDRMGALEGGEGVGHARGPDHAHVIDVGPGRKRGGDDLAREHGRGLARVHPKVYLPVGKGERPGKAGGHVKGEVGVGDAADPVRPKKMLHPGNYM